MEDFKPNIREITGKTESIVESVDDPRENLESDLDEDLKVSSCESETEDKVNSQNMNDHRQDQLLDLQQRDQQTQHLHRSERVLKIVQRKDLGRRTHLRPT